MVVVETRVGVAVDGIFSVTTTNELLAPSVVACQAIVVQTRWGVDGMVSMGMAKLCSGWHLCWGAGEEI